MKFHEFIFVFKGENLHYDTNIFEEILNLPSWAYLKKWYDNFETHLLNKNRKITDYEIPYKLCIEAFSKSQRLYYLIEDTYLTTCHPEYPVPTKPYIILTALEVFKRYGGSCMAEVQERIQYNVRTTLIPNVENQVKEPNFIEAEIMQEHIDIWKYLHISGVKIEIRILDNGFILEYTKEIKIELSEINRVRLYKLNQMTFDKVIVQINTKKYQIEIPYLVKILETSIINGKNYISKYNNEFLIPNFQNLITYFARKLDGFEKKWLDDNSIIDLNENFVDLYVTPHLQ